MADRRKKYPELELPPKINKMIIEYLGPRGMNKLTPEQRTKLAASINQLASDVGEIIAPKTEGV